MALYRYIDLAMHLVDRHLPADSAFGDDTQPVIDLESAEGCLRLRAISNSRPELHKDCFDYFQHFEIVSTDVTLGFESERGFEVAETIGVYLQRTEIAGENDLAVRSGLVTTVYRWGGEDNVDAFPDNEDSEHFLTLVTAAITEEKAANA